MLPGYAQGGLVTRECCGERLGIGAQGRPRTELTTLTPAAKRALLDAYQRSCAEDCTYLGPEHVLRALATDAQSAAGRALSESGLSDNGLPAGEKAHEYRRDPSSTPTVD
ncbi:MULTISPECIES: Clp protease N-terminal domain-containing protein [Streptomyces]|uniref:Clp R domain-containing protein n=1 Tax=Streptomyces canarius TaxID=285453 RepID=A0ABQ3DE59_9ACTN|nr:Clp protease N-terminal domain-containing protein [Streptomyces canarius]GHA77438.1 hypothetical protein GCM10010345_93820 [Streptomyces canarius]